MRDALEAALLDDPDDRATHMAYADVLIDEGDPRGDLIRTQLALEQEGLDRRQRAAHTRREKRLLAKHQREWLGDLAGPLLDGEGMYGRRLPVWALRLGWLHAVHDLWLSVPAARVLARSAGMRLVQSLSVEYACGEGEDEPWEPGDDVPDDVQFVSLFPLLRSPHLGNVRRLRLGFDPDVTRDSSYAFGHAAADLVALMPKIEELRLFTRGVDAEKLFALRTLTHLRRLDYYHDRRYPLDVLARNKALANLEGLAFFPHFYDDDADGSYLSLETVRPLFRSKNLPKLRHLMLRGSNMGDDGIDELIRGGMLNRLRVLDLRHGAVTDDGAERLAASPAAKALEALDLSDNALTPAGVAALQEAGIPLLADDQHAPGDDRYLQAGEFE